jgi:hypothetical protein
MSWASLYTGIDQIPVSELRTDGILNDSATQLDLLVHCSVFRLLPLPFGRGPSWRLCFVGQPSPSIQSVSQPSCVGIAAGEREA